MIRTHAHLGALKRLLWRSRPYTTNSSLSPVARLEDGSISRFKDEAFNPGTPALLPKGHFKSLAASKKWFHQPSTNAQYPSLNTTYLQTYSTTHVPLELTTADGKFSQIHQPLSFFLSAVSHPETLPQGTNIYLAQASIADLPRGMQADLPTPDLVLKAGKGDVYESSIWLGRAPTYTPLHRDPNPNLFVQLAGKKTVRIYRPEVGGMVFAYVQRVVGGAGNERMRGAEMMEGRERGVFEDVIWNKDGREELPWDGQGWECEVEAGDGLFIPKGWWHSIKGTGEGMTGSVSSQTCW